MKYRQENSGESENPSDKYTQEYLKFQIKQQEMFQAQEAKRLAREEENERKKREFAEKVNEYNLKCAQIPVNALKKWTGSWIVLVLSILSTVTVGCSLGSLISNFSNGAFSIITAIVQLLLACLVCAGFWRSYAMGRGKDPTVNSGGPRMLRGVLTFYKVMMYITMILIVVLAVMIFITLKSCADGATDQINKIPSEEITDVANTANSAFTGVLIGLLLAVIAVFVVLIIYFTFASRFANDVVTSLTSGSVARSKTLAITVLFFIVGGFSLIGAIGSVAATSLFKELLENLGDIGSAISKIVNTSKIDIANMLAQLANAGTYIFGGILALRFGSLANKVDSEIQALEKPVI